MKREIVKSSVISEVGYDETAHELEILFIGGKLYKYVDVPKNVYDDFMKAESKGKYFSEHIKHTYIFVE